MQDKLKEELYPEEKLLWSGAIEGFETMDKTNKAAYIKRAVLLCSVVAALCIIYVVYATSKGIDLKLGLIAIAAVLAVIGSLNFYSQAAKLRKMVYAITDQRIISIADVPKYVERKTVKDVELKMDDDGHMSLLFGKKVIESKSHQWRTYALLDPYVDTETGTCERFALYAVPDAESIKKVLCDFLRT